MWKTSYSGLQAMLCGLHNHTPQGIQCQAQESSCTELPAWLQDRSAYLQAPKCSSNYQGREAIAILAINNRVLFSSSGQQGRHAVCMIALSSSNHGHLQSFIAKCLVRIQNRLRHPCIALQSFGCDLRQPVCRARLPRNDICLGAGAGMLPP